ncbi:hypothetical protein [Solwaraspora sp. WMMA2101]|uniref:fluoroquinolone export ABC transporter permease subunit n=1 Tax=Solwaraspora sp. WMMA2101 TaxID=3404124 RepID=UPI003B95DEBC
MNRSRRRAAAARRSLRRLATAVALEVRVEWRYRIVAVAAVFALGWTVPLLAVPAPAARTLGPVLLFVDTAAFGAFFIALLLITERAEGALAALRVTPLRAGEQVGAKLGVLTGLSVVAAVPIAVVVGRDGGTWSTVAAAGLALLGVALTALLILLASLLLVLRQPTVAGYLTAAPLVLLPGLAVPLAYLTGLLDHPVGQLVPTTGTAELIRAGLAGTAAVSWWQVGASTGYAAGWIVGATLLALRRFDRVFAAPDAARRSAVTPARPAARPVPRSGWPVGWLPALLRVDLRALGADRLLAVLLCAPLLLAVALRFGVPSATAFVDQRYGVDLAAHRDLLLALLVLAHVPVIGGMVGALLLLDDVDERRLLLIRVTPVTLQRYLGYRVGVTAALTTVGLLIAVPLSGLADADPRWLVPAVLVAAGQAVLVLLAVTGYAANKVHGLALLKLFGGAVMVLAALPWLPVPAQWPAAASWPVALLPPAAVSLTQQAGAAGAYWPACGYAALGATVTVVGATLLARRVSTRFTS